MTDNEKIARWAGDYNYISGLTYDGDKPTVHYKFPDYSTDAEAIELLNALVSKGYSSKLQYTGHWSLEINKMPMGEFVSRAIQRATIRETIIAAVLQVIEKEEEK